MNLPHDNAPAQTLEQIAGRGRATLDAEHGLVLAGEVQSGSIGWCTPVDSDAEARRVVNEACGFRAKARAATDADDPASAAELLSRARALEGRLVDPFWRDLAAAAVEFALAA